MSPLPLPLGRLLRCARGAGSPASRTGPASRRAPALARAALGLAGCLPGPASSSPSRRPASSSQAFGPGLRGRGGREAERAASWSLRPGFPLDLTEWGGAPPAASASRSGAPSCLPSFLRLPSALACSPAIAAVSLHIVRSLLPLPSPPPRLAFGLGISSLFITYFDPASLCPRFLRKFYCPRSRAFD